MSPLSATVRTTPTADRTTFRTTFRTTLVVVVALAVAIGCARRSPPTVPRWSGATGRQHTLTYNDDVVVLAMAMHRASSLGSRAPSSQSSALSSTRPSIQAGQQIFLGSSCVYCHTVAGTNASGTVGPDLTHFAIRPSIAAVLPNTRPNLAAWIVNAQELKPGTAMPSMDIPGAQLQSLLMYLESLK